MYGHSLGGGSPAVAMHMGETRIAGALDFDGSIPPVKTVLAEGVNKPYMFMRAQRPEDTTWTQMWPHLNWGLEIQLHGSQHGTYLDTPLLAHLLGMEPVPPSVAKSIGRIPGDRAMEVITEYVHAFIGFVLTGKTPTLLKGESENFPEVDFIRSKHM
jgi:hypothetical protein